MKTLFVATAAFAALVIVAPIGKAHAHSAAFNHGVAIAQCWKAGERYDGGTLTQAELEGWDANCVETGMQHGAPPQPAGPPKVGSYCDVASPTSPRGSGNQTEVEYRHWSAICMDGRGE